MRRFASDVQSSRLNRLCRRRFAHDAGPESWLQAHGGNRGSPASPCRPVTDFAPPRYRLVTSDLPDAVVSSYTVTPRRAVIPQRARAVTATSMPRSTSSVFLIVVCVCLGLSPASGQTPDTRHVRAFDAMLRGLLDEGMERSATFRGLVQRIDRTDGIVYVQNGIAVIGHELQHAGEVLTARWVRNSATASALFIRIGSVESVRSFETAEAQRIGAVIAQELAASARRD
jgi:hypothetical protein